MNKENNVTSSGVTKKVEVRSTPSKKIFRGSVIFLVLNIYLFLAEGFKFTKNYNKIGLSGVIGGVSLGIANISFILSITTTTAAVTMMMLATQPFVAAILAYVFLKDCR